MPEFRRGKAAIEEAATRKSGGSMKSFAPSIRLTEDGEKKYILVLTPRDEVVTANFHEWVPVGKVARKDGSTFTKYEDFISRKDPAIGESYDDLEDRLGIVPKKRCIGVIAELEPVFEEVNGRKRPVEFTVKTRSFTRRTDDGEEEVVVPELGLFCQSAMTVWGPLSSYDESQGPLDILPIEITRRGKGNDTRYDFIPFMDIPVDLAPVRAFGNNISYIEDEVDVDSANDDLAAAHLVADALLDQRLGELVDPERYKSIIGPLDHIESKFNRKPVGNKPAATSTRATTAPVSSIPSRSERFAKLREKVESQS